MNPSVVSPPRYQLIVWLYLAVMVTGGPFLCFLIPPYQTPDEPSHLVRAVQVSEGTLFVQHDSGRHSGEIDSSYLDLLGQVHRLIGKTQERLSYQDITTLWDLRTTGRRVFAGYTYTAKYAAVGYFAPAIGVQIAQLFTNRVVVHLVAARAANFILFAVMSALAMLMFGPCIPAFLCMSAMPMVLLLAASAAQDATILGLSALLAAIVLRFLAFSPGAFASPGSGETDPRRRLLIGGSVIVCALCLARPPYLPLVPILPVCAALSASRNLFRLSIVLAALALVCVLIFTFVVQAGGGGWANGADPAAQAQFILTQPGGFVAAIYTTLEVHGWNLLYHLVGVLGWLDTVLPQKAYVAYAVLAGLSVVALTASLGAVPWRSGLLGRGWSSVTLLIVALAAGAGMVLLIFTAQYLTWTKPQQGIVDGVQGRHLIPAIIITVPIMLTVVVARLDFERLAPKFQRLSEFCSFALLAAMPVSQYFVGWVLLNRYYFP